MRSCDATDELLVLSNVSEGLNHIGEKKTLPCSATHSITYIKIKRLQDHRHKNGTSKNNEIKLTK